MKKNNYLVLVENTSIINEINKEIKESPVTFLFPVTDFSVGFTNTFDIDSIPCEGFIYINRVLDNKGIDNFKRLLNKIPSNIKGIVFDDLGILNVLQNTKHNLTTILFLNHFNCNSISINSYLKYVDSVVISTDITTDEAKYILDNALKPLVLYAFGHVNIMYSRRTLLTNYNNHFHENIKKETTITEEVSNQQLKVIENSYGTVIYTPHPFNNLTLKNHPNILYNLINTIYLTSNEIIAILKSSSTLDDIYPYKYLSTKETIYKIKEDKND